MTSKLHALDGLDRALNAMDATPDEATTPMLEITFSGRDSVAFEIKYAGISPPMFAAVAAWCTHMATTGFVQRDYAELLAQRASENTSHHD